MHACSIKILFKRATCARTPHTHPHSIIPAASTRMLTHVHATQRASHRECVCCVCVRERERDLGEAVLLAEGKGKSASEEVRV